MICSTGIAGGSCVMALVSLCAFAAGAGDAAGKCVGGAGCAAAEADGAGSGPCCCAAREKASAGAARIKIAAMCRGSVLVGDPNSLAISLASSALGSVHWTVRSAPRVACRGGHTLNYGAFREGLQTAREEKNKSFQRSGTLRRDDVFHFGFDLHSRKAGGIPASSERLDQQHAGNQPLPLDHRELLRLLGLDQHAQSGDFVLYLLKSAKHRLAVTGDVRVIAGARKLHLSTARPSGEYILPHVRADRPNRPPYV